MDKDQLIEKLQFELSRCNSIIEEIQITHNQLVKTLHDIDKYIDSKDKHYKTGLKKAINIIKSTNGTDQL